MTTILFWLVVWAFIYFMCTRDVPLRFRIKVSRLSDDALEELVDDLAVIHEGSHTLDLSFFRTKNAAALFRYARNKLRHRQEKAKERDRWQRTVDRIDRASGS